MNCYGPNFAVFYCPKKKKKYVYNKRFANIFTRRMGARLPASPHRYSNDKRRNTIRSGKPDTVIMVENRGKTTGTLSVPVVILTRRLLHRRFKPRE